MTTTAVTAVDFGDDNRVSWEIEFPGLSVHELVDWNGFEFTLSESLLTPGLSTIIHVQSANQTMPVKNLDSYKGINVKMKFNKPSLGSYNLPPSLNVDQTVYRIDNRKSIDNNTEEYYIHACHQSLLNDAAQLVSKRFKCTTPSDVTKYVLETCLGISPLVVEPSAPARDYNAENIHPFQIVAQQAEAALANGDDPSFVHYMTYEGLGTHKFESLHSMAQKSSVMKFEHTETGEPSGYGFPQRIMFHEFPCDFDLLSDILNGIGQDGGNLSSLMTVDLVSQVLSIFGNKTVGCGIGQGLVQQALTNMASARELNSCPDYTHLYAEKRQARMSLIEEKNVGLRLTVPWNPKLNVGKTIDIELWNKDAQQSGERVPNYGSGKYLIIALKHHIGFSGYGTTTMDCVSETVKQGVL